jgi:hypothetical protein
MDPVNDAVKLVVFPATNEQEAQPFPGEKLIAHKTTITKYKAITRRMQRALISVERI